MHELNMHACMHASKKEDKKQKKINETKRTNKGVAVGRDGGLTTKGRGGRLLGRLRRKQRFK